VLFDAAYLTEEGQMDTHCETPFILVVLSIYKLVDGQEA